MNYIFSAEDLAIGLIWFIIILVFGFVLANSLEKDQAKKWFIKNLLFKMFFGVFFGFTFVKILGYGGDTVAYWDGANKLKNLLLHSPLDYFQEMFRSANKEDIGDFFNAQTGYPPAWIYGESESFFISKIASIFSLITFGSYTAMTLIFSFFASLASFRLYQVVKSYNVASEFMTAMVTMFVPTVAFWCAGISKDTVILACLFFVLYHLFAFIDKNRKLKFYNIISLFFFAYLIYHIRPFMVYAILPPLGLAFLLGYINKVQNDIFVVLLKLGFVIFTGGLMLLVFVNVEVIENLDTFQEVAVVQQDFQANNTYGGPRYDLGVSDYSFFGMIKSAPLAIFTAFYRPLIWEAQGPLLLVSGLESIILLVLTLKFMFSGGGLFVQISRVSNNELLLFCLVFIFLFGFFVGFSSSMFNVLARFKTPILPFLFLVLASSKIKHEKVLEE